MTTPRLTAAACALLAAVTTSGCGEGYVDDGGQLGQLPQTITGGDLVTTGNNGTSPYSSIVYIRNNSEAAFCTATKIGQSATLDTYITAAHCMYPYERSPAGNSLILIGNGLDSNVTVQARSIANLFRHPSALSDPDTKESGQIRHASSRSYDIAIFQLTRDSSLPNIPVLPAAQGPLAGFISPGEDAHMIGYGCDEEDSSHSAKKQKADLFTTDREDATVANYARYIRTEGLPLGCPSDSGGPLFLGAGGSAGPMIGITSHRFQEDEPFSTHFGRVANVSRWIAAPHSNSAPFNGIGFLQHRTLRKCAFVSSRAVGTAGEMLDCEGYDPNIHHTLWDLVPVSGTNFFRIRMARTGADRCLTVATGTNVVSLQTCNGGQTQHWESIQHAAGDFLHYRIRNRSTQTILAPSSSGGLVVAAGTSSQWLFYR